MIDWQIKIDGREPPGWDQHRDGCAFPDFDHQEFLLPIFDVGDTPIDPYGGTSFDEADLRRLREHLRCHRPAFEAKPERWSITETVGQRSKTVELDREKALAVIDRTLAMIDSALSVGGILVFRGD